MAERPLGDRFPRTGIVEAEALTFFARGAGKNAVSKGTHRQWGVIYE